jgi:hypothetical protein
VTVRFKVGDRVRVVATWDWVGNPVGTIRSGPKELETLQGIKAVYQVRFDASAQDTEGEASYRCGPVFDEDLELVVETGVPSPGPK